MPGGGPVRNRHGDLAVARAATCPGPVYLVSSSDKLPNLVADLRGQVNVQLRGVVSSVKGAMKTTFPEIPDAPVTKFVLKMDGGAKGLIR